MGQGTYQAYMTVPETEIGRILPPKERLGQGKRQRNAGFQGREQTRLVVLKRRGARPNKRRKMGRQKIKREENDGFGIIIAKTRGMCYRHILAGPKTGHNMMGHEE